MQVNIQGVKQDLRRIGQIYSRLYNNEDTLGETKLNIKMEKRFRVTHQFNYSIVHNLICKVNKHVVLQLHFTLSTMTFAQQQTYFMMIGFFIRFDYKSGYHHIKIFAPHCKYLGFSLLCYGQLYGPSIWLIK